MKTKVPHTVKILKDVFSFILTLILMLFFAIILGLGAERAQADEIVWLSPDIDGKVSIYFGIEMHPEYNIPGRSVPADPAGQFGISYQYGIIEFYAGHTSSIPETFDNQMLITEYGVRFRVPLN